MRIAKFLFSVALLTMVLLGFASVTVFAQTPDPGLLGTLATSKQEYNLGDKAWKCPGFPDSVEVRGSVTYPTGLSAGPYPVLVFLHGRHETCYKTSSPSSTSSAWPCPTGWQSITSYAGYDYLAKQMASHGYIVISISCNSINATDNSSSDYGMQGRGELLQHHLDLWKNWNTVGGTPFGTTFVGKLDMKNIGTMGHSRGGEGVVFNAEYNRSLGSPYGIKAVLTLAPVDFLRHVLHGIPLLNVAPYCDGDVNNLQGVHFYDDARYTDTADYAPKHTILLMGANHNYFNTVWTPGSYIAGGADDWLYTGGASSDPHCSPGYIGNKRFDSTRQKAALNAYLSAFFRIYLGHESQFAPILDVDDITPPVSSTLDTTMVYVSFHPSKVNRLDLNRTDSLNKYTANTLAGAVTESGLVASEICGNGLIEPDCGVTTTGAKKPHNSSTALGLSQMGMQWSDSTQYYQNDIPAAYQNLSAYKNLMFRASVNFATVAAGTNLNFTVQLIDSSGNKASQVVSNFTHAMFRSPGTQPNDLPKLCFNTVKIPLAGFTGINMSKVRKVKFVFNKSATGSIFVSDLSFSNPECALLNAAFSDSVIHNTYRDTFTNTSSGSNGDSLVYKWDFGHPASGVNNTSTLKNPVHIYSAVGTYTICLYVTSYQKNSYICTDTFCKTRVVPTRVAVPELLENTVSIYPNPAKNYLVVTGVENTSNLTLLNLYGQIVLSVRIADPTIYLPDHLPNGVYTAVITSERGKVVRKVLLEH